METPATPGSPSTPGPGSSGTAGASSPRTPGTPGTPPILAIQLLTQAHFQFRTLYEAQAVADFLALACPNPRLAVIGITEIFYNAIEHGNLDINYEQKSYLHAQEDWAFEIEKRLHLPEYINKMVRVSVNKDHTNMTLIVLDEGKGFNWRKYHKEDPERARDSHGRGMAIARHLVFKSVTYSEKGNEVTCVIPLKEEIK